MKWSHICARCGTPLDTVVAARHPDLGLPVVVCPGCGYASVRRRPALLEDWRWFLRAGEALRRLIVQTVAALVCLVMAAMWNNFYYSLNYQSKVNLLDLLTGPAEKRAAVFDHLTKWYNSDGWAVLLMWSCLALFTGAWLCAGLSHIPLRKALAGWAVVLFGFNTLMFTLQMLIEYVRSVWPLPSRWGDRAGRGDEIEFVVNVLVMLPPTAVLVVAGVPLGALLKRVGRARARRRFGKRRARIRRWRSA